MKINSIILNQVIRIFTAALAPPEIDPHRLFEVLKAFEARYAFLQGPRVVADYDPQTGITFLQGHYGKSIIDKITIFGNGILSEAKISTDEIDAFLDDAITWARGEVGLPPLSAANERSRSYLSQVELESDIDLGAAFAWLTDFGKRLSDQLKDYGQNTRNYEVSGINLHCDISDLEIPKPGVSFRFDRRENKSYSAKTYFAAAPLRTLDHYRFIEEFEELLAAQS
jgi:hypothetical protein